MREAPRKVLVGTIYAYMGRLIQVNLQRAGYEVIQVNDHWEAHSAQGFWQSLFRPIDLKRIWAEAVLERAKSYHPDLVILDIPDLEGTACQIIRKLRAVPAVAKVPVILIPARHDLRCQDLEGEGIAYLFWPQCMLELPSLVVRVLEGDHSLYLNDPSPL